MQSILRYEPDQQFTDGHILPAMEEAESNIIRIENRYAMHLRHGWYIW